MKRAILLVVALVNGCACPGGTDDPGGDEPVGATVIIRKVDNDVSGTGTVTSSPAGIDCDTACVNGDDGFAQQFDFPADVTSITLEQEAERSALFESWSCVKAVDGALEPTIIENDPTLTFDVSEVAAGSAVVVDCTVSFRQLHTLLVIFAGQGTGTVVGTQPAPEGGTRIDCPGKCTAGYFKNDTETLIPTADPGSVFVGWSFSCDGTGEVTVTLDADKNCEARFEPE